MRRAKEKVGEFKSSSSSSSSSSMVRMERESSMGRKETRNMLFVINPYVLDNLLVCANTGLRAKRTDNVIVSYSFYIFIYIF